MAMPKNFNTYLKKSVFKFYYFYFDIFELFSNNLVSTVLNEQGIVPSTFLLLKTH